MTTNELAGICKAFEKVGLGDLIRESKERLEYCQTRDVSQFRVVVAGQYNSGKSSLLNALCNSVAEPYRFAMGDIPVTKGVDEETYESCLYVDTPGFGENPAERAAAAQEWGTASVILFVRSLVDNTQHQGESQELRHLCATVDSPEERILVVLSKSGQIDAAYIDASMEETRRHVQRETGHVLHVLCVDSQDYMEGMRAGEADMVTQSGIEQVRLWLEQKKHLRCVYVEAAIKSLKDTIPALLQAQKKSAQIVNELQEAKQKLVIHLSSIVIDLCKNMLLAYWKKVFSCEDKLKRLQ